MLTIVHVETGPRHRLVVRGDDDLASITSEHRDGDGVWTRGALVIVDAEHIPALIEALRKVKAP